MAAHRNPADLSKQELVSVVENILVSLYGSSDGDGGLMLHEERELTVESACAVEDDLREAGLVPDGLVSFQFTAL